jgi:hypothetical protein
MNKFKAFLDAIDCPGGHIVILVTLGVLGVVCVWLGHTDAAKPLLEALPIAFYAMRGLSRGNNNSEGGTTKE